MSLHRRLCIEEMPLLDIVSDCFMLLLLWLTSGVEEKREMGERSDRTARKQRFRVCVCVCHKPLSLCVLNLTPFFPPFSILFSLLIPFPTHPLAWSEFLKSPAPYTHTHKRLLASTELTWETRGMAQV